MDTLTHLPKKPYLCIFHGDGFKEFDYEEWKWVQEGWPTLSYAKLSAAEGCLICLLVCKSVAFYDSVNNRWEQFSSYSPSDIVFKWDRGEMGNIANLWIRHRDLNRSNRPEILLDVYVHKDSMLPNGSPFLYLNTKSRAHICSDPFSDASISVIQQWLDICHDTHEHCRMVSSNEDSQLPTRVLDIGLSSESSICLLESNGSRGKYIALSHCWSSQHEFWGAGTTTPLLKTTILTLEAHKDGIHWNRLSNTFQDAIKLTRLLGIHYIWIDSLCIIQGDAAEWLIESAKMESVYGNAHLVLAATDGHNGEHGFPMRPEAHQVSICDENDISHHLSLRRSVYSHHFALTVGQYAWQAPLVQRAWAFQERLLGLVCCTFVTPSSSGNAVLQRGPSWSWASGGRAVNYPPSHYQGVQIQRAEIHKIDIEFESPEAPLGRLKHGEITMTVQLLPVMFQKAEYVFSSSEPIFMGFLLTDRNEEFRFVYDRYIHEEGSATRLLDVQEPAHLIWLQSNVPDEEAIDTAIKLDETAAKTRSISEANIQDSEMRNKSDDADTGPSEIALVLKKAEKEAEYWRIGLLVARDLQFGGVMICMFSIESTNAMLGAVNITVKSGLSRFCNVLSA
ncbi:hypothetical protein G7Y89_g12407 [Cudoniella acicularis]|uniref:Heterokaryon incompatibility domain-containing protein n=1 Tax=Cudoniella acicularis TaxID=354080 RepID=A0A8H4R977_9HELO|nr:hypothetical protein G7Y89_g12407 [Cudoniella acicularis]